jgi:hypothetical protein
MLNDNTTLNKKVSISSLIKNNIINQCEHEWVKDLIDIDPDRSKEICYCIKCEMTKR